ncbi:iron export ABC transporter permease subunit FetB [Microbacteriaceae bacterium K1510]|nr:iron export ABC transporter permease subunit FetB [Microbacteriaceae bacterium K1510]
MTAVVLSPTDLAIASGLVVFSAALSAVLSLSVHRAIVVSALRMVVQLILVGLILRLIFASGSPWITAAVVAGMAVAASREVGARSRRKLSALWQFSTGAVAVVAATTPVVLIVLTTALKPTPWFDARHAIPLVGIVLGTVMNAASLALNTVLSDAAAERGSIEAQLAVGATRNEAFRPILRRAVNVGTTPTINQMAAAGIITMPGIMTGQVLAGMDPIEAAKYQILLMFALSAGGLLGSLVAAYTAVRRLTDDRHRLRLDRLRDH